MRQINDTGRASTGLGERVKPAPAPEPPKPVDTFATGNWLPDGLRETPKPDVDEDSLPDGIYWTGKVFEARCVSCERLTELLVGLDEIPMVGYEHYCYGSDRCLP